MPESKKKTVRAAAPEEPRKKPSAEKKKHPAAEPQKSPAPAETPAAPAGPPKRYHIRGREIVYRGNDWYYVDNGQKV